MSDAVSIARDDRIEGFCYLLGFMLCIPAANWLIGHVGTFCAPQGPCMIPVGPGILAPSGVVTVGLALVLRDLVQRRLGRAWSLAAIAGGAILSAALAPGALVLASTAAFLLSELADFAVYTPLQRRRFVVAVVASSAVGLVIDSILFLWLAFGSLEFLVGQIIGKAWMVLLSLPFIYWLRLRDARRLGPVAARG
jgi:queuosine precursor transporter